MKTGLLNVMTIMMVISTFDLRLIDDYIRGPLQSSTDFEVSYFLNATDAAFTHNNWNYKSNNIYKYP